MAFSSSKLSASAKRSGTLRRVRLAKISQPSASRRVTRLLNWTFPSFAP